MGKNNELYACVASNVGRVRKNNEDNFLLEDMINANSVDTIKYEKTNIKSGKWTCVAVFDGMGGAENGEIASLITATEFKNRLNNLSSDTSYEMVDSFVQEAFREANARVVTEGANGATCGTTGTVVMTDGVVFKIYHVGDSRAYLYRGEALYQLTTDQTVAELKRRAGFDEEDITEREHHQLVEFIGCDRSLKGMSATESSWIELKEGDIVLLCSDGLSDECTDSVIQIIMGNTKPKDMVEYLISYALEKGGRDNTTCAMLMLK